MVWQDKTEEIGIGVNLGLEFQPFKLELEIGWKKPNYLDMTKMVGIVFEKFKNDQFEPQISLVFIMLLHFVAVKNIL